MAILTVMSAYMSLPVCEPFSMWVLSTENSSLLIDAEMSTLALWRKYCHTVRHCASLFCLTEKNVRMQSTFYTLCHKYTLPNNISM